MENLIIIILLLIIVFFAGRYIYSQKKSGAKCIGCPNASCPHCKKR
ncbi:MAG: FeoB-associated Cys-rich membrane protein [Solobacterium sp.]|nr:FeoB-associated Cys-rich membrane protein [Solobacterium sp.]MDY2731584.1 FeoB-associated Cys-rich membrane protein [Erysipelotrichaceae bacterium]MDD5843654.1 FeoB-associated Cys-rich membrane protein [Solobacterium sp.]MDD5982446.1 FeoB-associated Cys-rich membrane protein [Solobacterium sp.]MDD6121501.1 FeoB-associated Cys-rich membrane protein [Solobacterium sp.]